jgi:hypothetical protein
MCGCRFADSTRLTNAFSKKWENLRSRYSTAFFVLQFSAACIPAFALPPGDGKLALQIMSGNLRPKSLIQ